VRRTGFFDPFAEPAKHFLAVHAFATVKAADAFQQLRLQFLKGLGGLGSTGSLVFLEAAETGANNFTGSLIQTTLDFIFHELCQFRRQ
jgi:hypothetical protein